MDLNKTISIQKLWNLATSEPMSHEKAIMIIREGDCDVSHHLVEVFGTYKERFI